MFEVFWGVRENMDSSLGGEECALNRIQSYGGPRRTDWELRALRTTIASGQLQVTLCVEAPCNPQPSAESY